MRIRKTFILLLFSCFFPGHVLYGDVMAQMSGSVLEFILPAQGEILESADQVSVSVKKKTATLNDLVVYFRTFDLDATAGSDYQEVEGSLLFDASDISSQTIVIPLFPDEIPETDEKIGLSFEWISDLGFGERFASEITILNDDVPYLDAGPNADIVFGEVLFLEGRATPSLSSLRTIWTVEYGPGTVQFDPPTNLISKATFSSPGEYVLKISGGLGSGYTRFDTLRVLVSENIPKKISLPSKNIFNISRNEKAQLNYELTSPGQIKIVIYDRFGFKSLQLLNQESPQGTFTIEWDGRDSSGKFVPAGLYEARFSENNRVRRLKIIVIK